MLKFVSKSLLKLISLMMLTSLTMLAVSCTEYDSEFVTAKDIYYAPESALLEPETLKTWIDNGMKTSTGVPVVIINVTGITPASVIKGSYGMPQNNYFTEGRSDGPVSVGNMVASGAKMDAALRYAGITKDTVVVITATNLAQHNIHRVWWTFSYWGFSNKNVKVLNGADYTFGTLFPTYLEAPSVPTTYSTFSVKELPGNSIDKLRAPLGEILEDVQMGAYLAGSKVLVPTMNPSNIVKDGATEVTRIANAGAVSGRIRGANQVSVQTARASELQTPANESFNFLAADGRYKSAAELQNLIRSYNDNASVLPADKSKRVIVHCGGGQSTAPYFFIMSQILGYTNAAIYDGSWSEWGVLNVYRAADNTSSFTRSNNTSYLTWVNNTTQYTNKADGATITSNIGLVPTGKLTNYLYDTTRYTDFLQFIPTTIPTNEFNNSYAGDAKEVNKADKIYQEGDTSGSTGGGNAGGSGAGGAPAGC